jgi:hypothetical protein
MIAGVGLAAHPAMHAGVAQPRRERRVEQQVVDAQAAVALPVLAEVVPEREDLLVRMLLP